MGKLVELPVRTKLGLTKPDFDIYFDWITSSSTGFSVYLFGRAISACQFFRKGEGAKIWFYKPEWEKGCDMKGGTFKAWKLPFWRLLAVKIPTGLNHSALGRLKALRFLTCRKACWRWIGMRHRHNMEQPLRICINVGCHDHTNHCQDYQGSVFFITLKDREHIIS